MKNIVASIKLCAVTLLICCVVYPLIFFTLAQMITPETANGSLLRNTEGNVIGSRLIGQSFSSPQYFWGRPSAVNYDGGGAGGSNLSPTSPELTARATDIIAQYKAGTHAPLPADLATASGGGLDPHISLNAAMYQAERVSKARQLPLETIHNMIQEHAVSAGGRFAPEQIVNVMELNLHVDRIK